MGPLQFVARASSSFLHTVFFVIRMKLTLCVFVLCSYLTLSAARTIPDRNDWENDADRTSHEKLHADQYPPPPEAPPPPPHGEPPLPPPEGLHPPPHGVPPPPPEGLPPPTQGLTQPLQGLSPPLQGLLPPPQGLYPPPPGEPISYPF